MVAWLRACGEDGAGGRRDRRRDRAAEPDVQPTPSPSTWAAAGCCCTTPDVGTRTTTPSPTSRTPASRSPATWWSRAPRRPSTTPTRSSGRRRSRACCRRLGGVVVPGHGDVVDPDFVAAQLTDIVEVADVAAAAAARRGRRRAGARRQPPRGGRPGRATSVSAAPSPTSGGRRRRRDGEPWLGAAVVRAAEEAGPTLQPNRTPERLPPRGRHRRPGGAGHGGDHATGGHHRPHATEHDRAAEVRQITTAQHQAFVAGPAVRVVPAGCPQWAGREAGLGLGERRVDRRSTAGLVGAALVLYRRIPRLNRSLAYLPEGPVIDWGARTSSAGWSRSCEHLRSRGAFTVRMGPPGAAPVVGDRHAARGDRRGRARARRRAAGRRRGCMRRR